MKRLKTCVNCEHCVLDKERDICDIWYCDIDMSSIEPTDEGCENYEAIY